MAPNTNVSVDVILDVMGSRSGLSGPTLFALSAEKGIIHYPDRHHFSND